MADAGNGVLMWQGYVLVFSAWQADVQSGEGHMLAEFPVATNKGAPIVGDSREEMIFGHTESPAVLPLTYPAHSLDQRDATLTVRQHEEGARVPVPDARWRYVSPGQIEIDLVKGFNELSGIRLPTISVPLGMHTGWSLRGAGFSPGALMLVGSYFPFAATKAERQANGDPRPSLEEHSPSHNAYVAAVARAVAELQEARLLLAEDAERYIAAAKASSIGG